MPGHRFASPESLELAGADVEDAIRHVRANADTFGLDAGRMALWAFSGGGPFLSIALREPPPYVRALVAYYAALDLQQRPPGASAAVSDDDDRSREIVGRTFQFLRARLRAA